ncbi:MAG: multicopper oxidase domain-containing protein [Methanospirillum sp.]
MTMNDPSHTRPPGPRTGFPVRLLAVGLLIALLLVCAGAIGAAAGADVAAGADPALNAVGAKQQPAAAPTVVTPKATATNKNNGKSETTSGGNAATGSKYKGKVTPEERAAAGERYKQAVQASRATSAMVMPTPAPGDPPHYFGPYPNYANSPMPKGAVTNITIVDGGTGYFSPVVEIVDLYNTGSGATATATADPATGAITGVTITNGGTGYSAPVVYVSNTTAPQGANANIEATIGGALTGGIRKFMSALPSISVAVPDTTTYPGADYYEIELRQYTEQMHPDLPATTLRGYVQVKSGRDVAPISYLGPAIVATKDRPVRIKFTNKLPTGAGGDLFLPVDTTVMGAGMAPDGVSMYTENRATLHLHGGRTPWISDGTPHQWITPAGENTPYPKGVSVYNVPDMPDPGPGSETFYYTNQQSARLMFYHDHSYGITRLNVYAGEAAPYLVTDKVEQDLIAGTNVSGVNPTNAKVLPDAGIPLVIQDKTFVDASTIGFQDPTWQWGSMPGMAMTGDLWMPHVYMTNQNPYDLSGMNPFGRWHYGPWFYPPTTNIAHGPIANPYYNASNPDPMEPPMIPGVPSNSMGMEAFMDTPVVNGEAYPYLDVQPQAYRFRILNAADDRFVNLQLYVADPNVTTIDGRTNTEVRMVPAPDGREGGVPDPAMAGPNMIQIANDGGFLPAPVVIKNQPVGWNLDQTNFDFGNVNKGALITGPAERADVIIDFSQYAGKTLILYNDAPAPFPAIDPRYDYYTGHPDQTSIGGAPTTQAGFGPNTRTIMQIRVAAATPAPAYNLAALQAAFAKTAGKLGVFEASQDPIIVPDAKYNSAYNASFPADQYARIQMYSLTYKNVTGATVTNSFEPKALHDEMGAAFENEYGRMSSMLGLELPNAAATTQNFLLYPFAAPPTELVASTGIYGTYLGNTTQGVQFWRITHNGVDTHTIHTHLFDAQLINRVAWDNAVRLPEPNELGWKDTIRVNPLQETIIAFRPVQPTTPFEVPNSMRLIDPTMPEGATLPGGPFGLTDPAGNAVTVTNHYVNYGWEYVYHCHLLSHEEMDMMRSVVLAVAPRPPSTLTATRLNGNQGIQLGWVDGSKTETAFVIQRALDANFTNAVTTFTVGANVTTYTDATAAPTTQYFYRVAARNVVGDTGTPGFPTKTADSAWSNTASPATGPAAPSAPTNVQATSALVNNNLNARVSLTWTDTSTTETGFRIQQATDAGFTANVVTTTVPANIVRFRTANLPRHANYYFRVQAYNAAGPSAWTNAVPSPINTG